MFLFLLLPGGTRGVRRQTGSVYDSRNTDMLFLGTWNCDGLTAHAATGTD